MVPDPRESLPALVDETLDLPAAYHVALDAGLTALGLDVDPQARNAIAGHLRLLLAWTASINLTAIRDPVVAASAHVLDSLSALPWLRTRTVPTLLDLGSGGGFPGIPLAACLPGTAVTLVEATGKKARFLETAIAAVGLASRVSVRATRAETLGRTPATRGTWSIVTARAVASSADLVELAFPLLAPGGSLIAWKRGDLDDDLRGAERALAALGGGRLDVHPVTPGVPGLGGHALVVATRRSAAAIDRAFPREPAARARHPW